MTNITAVLFLVKKYDFYSKKEKWINLYFQLIILTAYYHIMDFNKTEMLYDFVKGK